MSDIVDKENRGPFVLQSDGTMSDRELWAVELDPATDKALSDYAAIALMGEAAKAELAIREGQQAFESLMEDLKKY